MAVERLVGALLLAGCASSDYAYRYCPDRDLVINEVLSSAIQETGAQDFVEIYNDGKETIPLARWVLSRTELGSHYVIPTSYVDGQGIEQSSDLPPGGWLVIAAYSYIPDDGTLVTGFDLNRDADGIWLRDPDSNLCDAALYGDQHGGFSYGRGPPDGRTPDGKDEWCIQEEPTPGEANSACHDPDGGLP